VACAAAAAGQSLADAARQAQEQSRANEGRTLAITRLPAPPPEGRPPRLTDDLVIDYGNARVALAVFRRHAPDVQKRLLEATRGLRHMEDLEGVLAGEPEVVLLLEQHHLTPQRFVDVDMVLRRAVQAGDDRALRPERVTQRELENYRFLAENRWLVASVWQRCGAAEQNLQLWIGGVPSVQ